MSASRCPMKFFHKKKEEAEPQVCPITGKVVGEEGQEAGDPFEKIHTAAKAASTAAEGSQQGGEGKAKTNPLNNMAIEERQKPGPGQRYPLSTHRLESTIDKGDFTPGHQTEGDRKWMYPSQQMYYNAMKRKGWDPKEEDMPSIVAIHNTVNEEGWRHVREWEAIEGNAQPRLTKFSGDASKLTPKARLMGLLGYTLPFDRHDWLVSRCDAAGGNCEDIRYVIDFYAGKATPEKPVSMYLDVRPALDSLSALLLRAKYQVNAFVPGTFGCGAAAAAQPRTHHTHIATSTVTPPPATAGDAGSGCPVDHSSPPPSSSSSSSSSSGCPIR